MKTEYRNNEYGTLVSVHVCETCGTEFTICPAVPDDKNDQWKNCMSSECASYDPRRDVEFLLKHGEATLEREPARPLNARR